MEEYEKYTKKNPAFVRPIIKKPKVSTNHAKLKEEIEAYIQNNDFKVDPERYEVKPMAWIFNQMKNSIKKNTQHFHYLFDKTNKYEIVFCYTARLNRLKRVNGVLKKILTPKGFRQDKFVTLKPQLEPFFSYIPEFASHKSCRESFASLFHLFYRDPECTTPYIPKRRRSQLNKRAKKIKEETTSESESGSDVSRMNTPDSTTENDTEKDENENEVEIKLETINEYPNLQMTEMKTYKFVPGYPEQTPTASSSRITTPIPCLYLDQHPFSSDLQALQTLQTNPHAFDSINQSSLGSILDFNIPPPFNLHLPPPHSTFSFHHFMTGSMDQSCSKFVTFSHSNGGIQNVPFDSPTSHEPLSPLKKDPYLGLESIMNTTVDPEMF